METIKKIYSQNKSIIVTAFMLVFCAEVFCNILSYYLCYEGAIDLNFFADIILRISSMFGGAFIAYRFSDSIKVNYAPFIAAGCVGLTLMCNGSGYIEFFNLKFEMLPLASVLTVYFLAVYYMNYCQDSVKHTLFYMLLGITFFFNTAGEIDAFFIASLQILLFASMQRKMSNRHIRAINIIYSIFSAFWLVLLFAGNIYDYVTFKFEEGHMRVRIKAVIDTMKPFGKTESVSDIGAASSNYNLVRICGFFGYVAGVIAFAILTAFIVSICIKAYKNKTSPQPAAITTVTVLGIRYVASVLINGGILFGEIDVRIPVLSDDALGYLLIGLLLGALFVKENTEPG